MKRSGFWFQTFKPKAPFQIFQTYSNLVQI
jgi:hypothetical protein